MHQDMEIADINLDGRPDVVASDINGLVLFTWNEDGTFHVLEFEDTFGEAGITVADVTEDGFPDILALRDFYWTMSLWENPGVPAGVTLMLEPAVEPPYVVTPGGQIEFALHVAHNLPASLSGYLWSVAVLPNGSTSSPLAILPVSWEGVGYPTYADLSQTIPAVAPTGTYQFRVLAGLQVNQPVAMDEFEVLVLPPTD